MTLPDNDDAKIVEKRKVEGNFSDYLRTFWCENDVEFFPKGSQIFFTRKYYKNWKKFGK